VCGNLQNHSLQVGKRISPSSCLGCVGWTSGDSGAGKLGAGIMIGNMHGRCRQAGIAAPSSFPKLTSASNLSLRPCSSLEPNMLDRVLSRKPGEPGERRNRSRAATRLEYLNNKSNRHAAAVFLTENLTRRVTLGHGTRRDTHGQMCSA